MIVSFTRAKAEMISDGSKDELEPHDSAIHAAKSDSWDGITEWEELPHSLVNWVQSQPGLCIDQVPMSSIDELVTAYYLLHIEGDPTIQNPAQVLVSVAQKYLSSVICSGPKGTRDLVVPGEPPRHIMARRCSRCKQRVLDHAFAYYAKGDPRYYVTSYVEKCGHPSCGGWAKLVPENRHQPHRRNIQNYLKFIKTAPWEEYFLRGSTDEIPHAGMPVHIRCRKCGSQSVDETPRWTTHQDPKYLLREKKCSCQSSTWEIVDASIPTTSGGALSKHWKKFLDNGIDLTQYPRRCHIYWSQAYMITKRQQLEEEKAKVEKAAT
jgi:hypothetical protein